MSEPAHRAAKPEEETVPHQVIDQSAGTYRGGYLLTRIVRVRDNTVRVHIHRDSYPDQSSAVAEVLSADLTTWTRLVDKHFSKWHSYTKYEVKDPVFALGSIADELVMRAANVLDAHSQ